MGKMFNYYDGHNSLIAFEGRAKGGDYPWEKFTLPDQSKILRTFINAYRVRGGFYAPYKRPSVTLSTEELATIFHFPSEESQVPGMQKAQARSVPPPTNLPV